MRKESPRYQKPFRDSQDPLSLLAIRLLSPCGFRGLGFLTNPKRQSPRPYAVDGGVLSGPYGFGFIKVIVNFSKLEHGCRMLRATTPNASPYRHEDNEL